MAKQQNVPTPDLAELESLDGWADLAPRERTTVQTAAEELAKALYTEGQSKLSIGAHLYTIREILQPARMWMTFLKKHFHMSAATAYRYISDHQAVSKALPENVMNIALSRGYKIKPTASFKNPPPKTASTQEIVHYLDKMVAPPKQVIVVEPLDTDILLKECINFVKTRFSRLANQRQKNSFVRGLVGMLLTTFGMSSEQSFAPIAVPSYFKAQRGRPRTKAA